MFVFGRIVEVGFPFHDHVVSPKGDVTMPSLAIKLIKADKSIVIFITCKFAHFNFRTLHFSEFNIILLTFKIQLLVILQRVSNLFF